MLQHREALHSPHGVEACLCCRGADNVELGTACGKLHRVSVLAITDAGAPLLSHSVRTPC